MGARSKQAKRIRSASDFDASRLRAALKMPRDGGGANIFAWTLPDIRAARDSQQRGHFYLPARLAESMRTDDAIAVAKENRLAPQRCVDVEMVPAKGARGAAIAAEADALFGANGVGIRPETLADVNGCLADHGVAFACCNAQPRDDGSRVDYFVEYWPIEFVRWDPVYRIFKTRVDPTSVPDSEISKADIESGVYGPIGGAELPIIHGDGRWVIFAKHEKMPWKHEAAILPAALVWARHAFAARDWAKGSVAHGQAKMVGEMPMGMALNGPDGQLTAEAAAFLELLRAIASDELPIGIRPAGAKTDFLVNNSTAWQVWNELVLNAERAAARIYLGTDGMLGAQGGAPGVDISQLFGVATTKVQGDLSCIERGLRTGVLEPWTAMNFGDSTLAPTRKYLLPDADEDARFKSFAERQTAFFADVKAARDNGFQITQEWVDELADKHGVAAPALPIETSKAPTMTLAPTDIAKVVTVNEARASAGVGPLLRADGTADPDGSMTVEAYSAKTAGSSTAPSASPGASLRKLAAG